MHAQGYVVQYGVPTPVDGNVSIQRTICYIKRVDRSSLLSTLGLIYSLVAFE